MFLTLQVCEGLPKKDCIAQNRCVYKGERPSKVNAPKSRRAESDSIVTELSISTELDNSYCDQRGSGGGGLDFVNDPDLSYVLRI